MSKQEELNMTRISVSEKQANKTRELDKTISLLNSISNDLEIPQQLNEVINELWGFGRIESGGIHLDCLNGIDNNNYFNHFHLYDRHDGIYASEPVYEGVGFSIRAVAKWPKYDPGREGQVVDGALRGDVSPHLENRCITLGVVMGWDKILKKIRGRAIRYDTDDSNSINSASSESIELFELSEQQTPNSISFKVTETDINFVKEKILLACLELEKYIHFPLTTTIEKDKEEINDAISHGYIDQSEVSREVFIDADYRSHYWEIESPHVTLSHHWNVESPPKTL